jgi:hypothetical protein
LAVFPRLNLAVAKKKSKEVATCAGQNEKFPIPKARGNS